MNIHMPVEITDSTVDTLNYYFGVRDPLEDDPWFAERPKQPASLDFQGELEDLPAQVQILGQPPRLTQGIDAFSARVPIVVQGEIRTFTGVFTETTPTSNLFRLTLTFTIPNPPPKEQWSVKDIINREGSGKGTYYPYNVRVKGIPDPENFLFEYDGTRYELEEYEGWFYLKGGSSGNRNQSHDPDDTGKARDIGTDSEGKLNRKLKAKDIPTGYKFIAREGFAAFAKKDVGNPYLAIISNCDNSSMVETIEIDGVKWPKKSAFDYEQDLKYNLDGNTVLVAVNDDCQSTHRLRVLVNG